MKKPSDYINLLPREEKKASLFLSKGSIILGLFVLAWLVLLGWQGHKLLDLRSRLNSFTIKKNEYRQQLVALYKELGISLPVGMTPEKAWLIQSILSERILWSEVFKQFSLIVPRGMWFDSLEGSSVGKAEIKIRGGALNYLMIAEFMRALGKSPYFEKPQLIFAQKAVVQGQETVGFEIVCGVKKMRGAP
jgi:hypothetical protein